MTPNSKPKKRKKVKEEDDVSDAEMNARDGYGVWDEFEEEFHRCEDYKT